MTRDDMLTKLRDDRDAAAARGGLVEALILNDRIRDLKSGATRFPKPKSPPEVRGVARSGLILSTREARPC